MSVGETIRYYRKAQGLSQQQLAARLGWKHHGSITYYERISIPSREWHSMTFQAHTGGQSLPGNGTR